MSAEPSSFPGPAGHHHPRGTLVIVLGVLAVAGVPVLGPVAWSVASRALREADSQPGPVVNRGQLVAGRTMGMIGTAVLALMVAVFVATVILVVLFGIE
ncbi:hypothetical protein BJF86_03120 [Serinicoccus sp. CNJ-927]|nr:hypothetical protein BJF86_03120 [Serinicoccus sp. CNJ-927]